MEEAVKSAAALLCISKAAALGDLCFSYILEHVKAGVSEKAIAAKIEAFLAENGSEGMAFPVICVSGERTNLPHGEPSDKLIEKGDFVTLDFGAIIGGYCGDMTRTVAVGRVTEEQRRVYSAVLNAQRAALAAARPGARCADVDKAARDVIESAGYGEYYVHGTGHGVGTKVHEPPTLNAASRQILEEDTPVTVEPGVYIPGRFGARIEDLIIIAKFGAVNLVRSAKELIILP
jgi:Xaa-Pro aminopeptidase